MSDLARQAALVALLQIERGAPAGLALDRALAGLALEGRDRALATELAYGVTRQLLALDRELAGLSHRPLRGLQPPVRAALRLGLYQLRYTDRIPPHAAVSSSVELVRGHARPEAAALVNAVLRRAAAAARPRPPAGPGPVEQLAAQHSHPEWLVRRWLGRLGAAETEDLLRANNRRPAVTLRANGLRNSGAELMADLRGARVACQPGALLPEAVVLAPGTPPAGLAALAEGRCTVQDESSMLVAHLACPEPGARCLDVAASPGGKASHLAEWMGDRGEVIANDVQPARADRCRQAAERLGLHSLHTHVADARELPRSFADACDLVLADVPCSGLGALAGRPDLRWRKREADIAALATLQSEILVAAGACVKRGGRLVYSTCTTEPEENEAVVASFLSSHADFAPEDLRGRLPAPLVADDGAPAGWVRLWPQRHGTQGFFIAVLRRTPTV